MENLCVLEDGVMVRFNPAADIIDGVVGGISEVGDILDDWRTTDEERLVLANKAVELDNQRVAIVAEIAKVEAAHGSVFVAGARPFILWVCGITLAIIYIPQSIVATYYWAQFVGRTGVFVEYPIGIENILSIIGVALIGKGLRTAEKFKGVARGSLKE